MFPSVIEAGTTVSCSISDSSHSATDGWTLTAYLVGKSSISTTGVANGSGFTVTFTAAQTSPLSAGAYTYAFRASKAGIVDTLATGIITVTANIATQATRILHCERMLEYIEAQMEGRLSTQDAIDALSIDSRSLRLMSMNELREMRGAYMKERFILTKSSTAGALKITPFVVGRIP